MATVKCDICGNEITVEGVNSPEQVPQEALSVDDMLTEILLNTQEQCTMVDDLIHNQINLKDSQISKLHDELQYYKDDQAAKFVNQVMKAVIKVRKDMQKLINSAKWDELSVEDMKREYEYAFDDLTDLLEQQNIDPYETLAGELFDASIHQVHKLVATQDESLDKRIKESVSEGYTKGDKVLIVERVLVYQYKPQA